MQLGVGEWAVRGINGACPRRDAASPRVRPAATACAPLGMAPRKRPIRPFPQGLARGCFEDRAMQAQVEKQITKRQDLASGGPGHPICRLPNAPKEEQTFRNKMTVEEFAK